jgi:hypothetical protein
VKSNAGGSTVENDKFVQKKLKHKSYEIIEHIKEIKSECKVALLLIENSRNIRSVDLKIGGIAIRAEIVKIDFLMKNLKRSDHLTCKSLSCFNKMLDDSELIRKKNSIKIYLSTATEFLDKMGELLDNPNSCVVRETCRVLSNFVSKPDGMTLWLKFDSNRIGIDSSCVRHVKVYGEPVRIPEGTGYYQLYKKCNTFEEIINDRKEKMLKFSNKAITDNFGVVQDNEEEKDKTGGDLASQTFVELRIDAGVVFNFGDL